MQIFLRNLKHLSTTLVLLLISTTSLSLSASAWGSDAKEAKESKKAKSTASPSVQTEEERALWAEAKKNPFLQNDPESRFFLEGKKNLSKIVDDDTEMMDDTEMIQDLTDIFADFLITTVKITPKRTPTGAVVLILENHTKFGDALVTPSGKVFSYMGKNKTWQQANKECLNKNSNEEVRAKIKDILEQEDKQRKEIYDRLRRANLEIFWDSLNLNSKIEKNLTSIHGFYPSRIEELRELGILLGYSEKNSKYKSDIWPSLKDQWFWSTTVYRDYPFNGLGFCGERGYVGGVIRCEHLSALCSWR